MEEHGFDRYLTLLENLGEYFFISLLLGLSVTLLVESWRENRNYLLAAVIFGTVLGYGVQQVEAWKSFSVLATLFGTISGPATIALIQRKTLLDLAKDLQDVADRVTVKGTSSSPKSNGDARRALPDAGDPFDKS